MGEQQPAAVELFLEISVENCNVEQSSHKHHPLHNLEYMQIKNISTPVAQWNVKTLCILSLKIMV